jgi:uncharacterized protein
MRLSKYEIESIINACDQLMINSKAQLYLFGSRTNNTLKGGDIDLLLVVNEEAYEIIAANKIALLVAIKEKIGDQKIDLIIVSSKTRHTDNFINNIMQEAVLIKSWPI